MWSVSSTCATTLPPTALDASDNIQSSKRWRLGSAGCASGYHFAGFCRSILKFARLRRFCRSLKSHRSGAKSAVAVCCSRVRTDAFATA